LVFGHKSFHGDASQVGVRQQELHGMARSPRLVILMPVP
jgi:hypothetical protein